MKATSNLDRIHVATPCPASWEQMTGDDRVRFCDECQLNVYNLSALTRIEAESLIAASEGKLCGRFFRRADGTVITSDCPVGLRALRLRVSKRVAAVFAAIVSLTSAAFGQQASPDKPVACPTQAKITRLDPTKGTATANTISGSVHDIVGGSVADATITINSPSLSTPLTISTDKDGNFQSGVVPSGTYSVTINGLAFLPLTLDEVVIAGSEALRIDAVLNVQPFTGLITVAIDPALIKSKPTPNTKVIDQDMIKRLPLNNETFPFKP
ncbi:MAG TPA: carboxypeptidase-like regulatory domain-containing protein [Pyrinomonadaceae bacterium]|nr:carboxypeptidase-like regulatory domain-containing protein [Pyrinomonadaceae bacterium]